MMIVFYELWSMINSNSHTRKAKGIKQSNNSLLTCAGEVGIICTRRNLFIRVSSSKADDIMENILAY